MTIVYLGLGANLGDRRAALQQAVAALARDGIRVARISHVVETPALLMRDSPQHWDRPYLNVVVQCEGDGSSADWLRIIKRIEAEMGREAGPKWSPRPIDIDILLWGDEQVHTEQLCIPHPEMLRRDFVLGPLACLAPGLRLPGGATVLEHKRALGRCEPVWMGILNLTPDSFSDGGRLNSEADLIAGLEDMKSAGASIIDLGAESTRPGAQPITADEEWQRLELAVRYATQSWAGDSLAPRISVDTRHPAVVERALEAGVTIINDVTGLTDPAIIALAKDSEAEWIAMHHITIPADSNQVLPTHAEPVGQVLEWFSERLEVWDAAGLDRDRLVLDPGVGFGKTGAQSWQLVRAAPRLFELGCRVMFGHSRKSFLESVTAEAASERDVETVAVSLSLAAMGVDLLRVHNVGDHVRAYRAWAKAGELGLRA